MVTKSDLHQMVDDLPDADVETVARVIRDLGPEGDPFLAALLRAEVDDEPFTEADAEALEAARADFAAGRFLTGNAAWRAIASDD